MLRGDGGERHAKRHLAPKRGPVRKLVEFGPVELGGLLYRDLEYSVALDNPKFQAFV